jgi:hypothetical protein
LGSFCNVLIIYIIILFTIRCPHYEKTRCFNSVALTLIILVASLFSAGAQQTATGTAVLAGQFVVSVTVNFGGSGYAFVPTVTFSGGGGSGAGAFATINNGAVASVTVTNAGSGYSTAPSVTISAPSSPPFSSSMVLDLPMDGTVVDAGPNHFTVTTNGSGTFVPDRFGFANKAFSLNGVNQNITIPYNSLLYPTQFTLSAWVKFGQLTGTFWSAGNASADSWRGYNLYFNLNAFNYADFNGSGYNATIIYNPINWSAWKHIVITRTSSTATFFLNGVKINSSTGLTAYAKPQVAPMNIGANNGYGPFFDFCNVTFDAVHIYNRALSDVEVQALNTFEAINTNQVPALNMTVKTIRVNMFQLLTNYTYQLQRSGDLVNWTNVANSFVATNTSSYQDFDIIDSGQGNFRLLRF